MAFSQALYCRSIFSTWTDMLEPRDTQAKNVLYRSGHRGLGAKLTNKNQTLDAGLHSSRRNPSVADLRLVSDIVHLYPPPVVHPRNPKLRSNNQQPTIDNNVANQRR
jgi:hypothetical protein